MIIRVLLVLLLLPSIAQATTYWVSPSGGSSTCSAVDGNTDPGVYMTFAQIDASNCAGSGDTIMAKSGIYTGAAIKFNLLFTANGTPSAMNKVLCENNRGCDLRTGQNFGVIVWIENAPNFQFGQDGFGFKITCNPGVVVAPFDDCQSIGLRISTGGGIISNVLIEGNHLTGCTLNCFNNSERQPIDYFTNVTFRKNRVDALLADLSSTGDPHPVYYSGDSGIIEYNEVYANSGYALHDYHMCFNTIWRYNRVTTGPVAGGGFTCTDNEQGRATNTLVYGNTFKWTGAPGDGTCMRMFNASDGMKIYNNVCDGYNSFISQNPDAPVEFKNNLCTNGNCLFRSCTNAGSCTTTPTPATLTCGGTCSVTNPIVTASTHFRDAANYDYTLKAGSSQIDAGLATGFAFNGTARDRGAHETFVFASCEVQAGSTNMVRVTFTNNAFPPLLPATGATTFTVRRNGSNNVVTGSVNRSGDGIFVIPVTTSYVGGDTVDISLSTNNITDSALIGGTVSQPYVGTLTNQSCTNNAGGASFTFTQAAYELHDWLGSESCPVLLPYGKEPTGSAENFSNYKVRKGGKIRLRVSVVCGVADCLPTAFNLYLSTGGAYSALTDSFGVSGEFKFCGEVTGAPTNGGPTTDQLSTAGTFVPGGIMYTASAIPTVAGLNNGYKTELEYCVDVRNTASTGNVDFRVYQQDGTALDTYTVTPRLTIEDGSAGAQ